MGINDYCDDDYNGASYGYSPYDMLDWECHNWGERESEDYDCCDDAEDYGEEEQ